VKYKENNALCQINLETRQWKSLWKSANWPNSLSRHPRLPSLIASFRAIRAPPGERFASRDDRPSSSYIVNNRMVTTVSVPRLHGFHLVPREGCPPLLHDSITIPDHQVHLRQVVQILVWSPVYHQNVRQLPWLEPTNAVGEAQQFGVG